MIIFLIHKAPYFYDKIIEAGYNNILVIRSLLNHFYFLLSFKENSLNDINKKSIIHFSRQKLINKQIQVLNIKKINLIISKIFKLEKQCKLEYSIANLLIKKFLMNYSVY